MIYGKNPLVPVNIKQYFSKNKNYFFSKLLMLTQYVKCMVYILFVKKKQCRT